MGASGIWQTFDPNLTSVILTFSKTELKIMCKITVIKECVKIITRASNVNRLDTMSVLLCAVVEKLQQETRNLPLLVISNGGHGEL